MIDASPRGVGVSKVGMPLRQTRLPSLLAGEGSGVRGAENDDVELQLQVEERT